MRLFRPWPLVAAFVLLMGGLTISAYIRMTGNETHAVKMMKRFVADRYPLAEKVVTTCVKLNPASSSERCTARGLLKKNIPFSIIAMCPSEATSLSEDHTCEEVPGAQLRSADINAARHSRRAASFISHGHQ